MGNCMAFINHSKLKKKKNTFTNLDLYLEDAHDSDSSDQYQRRIRRNRINNNSNGTTISNDISNSNDQRSSHITNGNISNSYENSENESYIQHNNSENIDKEKGTKDNNNTENDKNAQSYKSINHQTHNDSISCNCEKNDHGQCDCELNKSNQLCEKSGTSTSIATIISPNIPKRKQKQNVLNIKYSNMALSDIRDADIIITFLFSLFLYFNANNIVDMFDRNKKERYSLKNPLNINHDVIKFPTFPKEIIDNFLKNDFTLLKKYIKNKCNKLKKKYRTNLENGNNEKEEKSGKKNFKYELKIKKEKCTFAKIVESVDRNESTFRDITEILYDENMPDIKITFVVMGAYSFYQKNMKPFQDKNTFFYKSPSYSCDAEISVACKKGRKLDCPNQDDFTIIQTNEWILIMVFDGHGPSGHDISNFSHVVLPLIFSYNIERIFENPVRTMKTIFYMINCYLVNYSYCINNNINPININFIDYNLSGTTCTIILYNFLTKKIYSAHTGDSRAVMGKHDAKTNTYKAYNITEDHKPSLKLEKDRIQAFGGEVKKLQGDVSYRVFVKNEMYPGLAMSRAIGDITSSFIGVTCEPTIKIFDKTDEDKFIIVATDGIWEFISSEECVQMVARKRKKKVHVAMEEIIKESWRRWERIDTVDDMTLAILYF
ncbi:protein phosphatase PPM6, putative [Plasmodium vinckei vinckei]|uniref:Protein phosphatase PPM6, putative n=1 Tax=Plasmodium vinckei vinckei TaxID=54757 RepID=A0A449BZJ2_PLAVN|nr:protein phosphatase PPM6, putative [Plasmodium vinckei vinckei]VEV58853.1 protein phosphatase PPM6, putative [Plasmodium vinckei vinckei]